MHKWQHKTVPTFKPGWLAALVPALKYTAHFLWDNREQNSEFFNNISTRQ
jgi:hypothetical protein